MHGTHVSVSANSSVSEQLAIDFLKLLRDAADASTPTPSVENLQAFFGRLDLVRNDGSKVNDAAVMQQPVDSAVGSHVFVSAQTGGSDRVVISPDFLHWGCREHSVGG